MANQSFNLRGGLPHFKNKLSRNEPVVVAFLGGSITEGAGASDPDLTSWRALTGCYLKERYSEERVTCINAGVGGTTSTFGAHRLREHVLSRGEIALLFVEFSVNDGEDREQSIRGMEGIVRQCRRESPHTDICFVYTAADKNLSEGLPFNIAVHEEVASHYGIPSVNFAARIRQRELTGEGDWGELANDRVHPNDAGHALYAEYMREYLQLVLIEGSRNTSDDQGNASLPVSLIKPSYEYASMPGFGIANNLNGFAVIDAYPGPMMNWRYEIDHLRADEPGASLTFSVTGRSAGILLLCGPDSGIFEYSLDGVSFQEVNLFDEWCLMAYRPVIAMFPIQEHRTDMRIVVRNTAKKDDRSTGTGLRILRFLSN
ncbi:SGNH/GDSL hydrolase family protein [Cohnella silvisoli]|uniref:SGNH/GDSL hydrolase family protein n=1 Tax=Cohnella silvisoli TaxID=2873699 RepID=A0ABV1KRC0_9BACL|nr:SGNH/GDSL hydrolase family protein [Cohnella silvisoli]MCD9021667.1 SGNH/GDSL hydrolase family protein [Cohnella silvisoli]